MGEKYTYRSGYELPETEESLAIAEAAKNRRASAAKGIRDFGKTLLNFFTKNHMTPEMQKQLYEQSYARYLEKEKKRKKHRNYLNGEHR